MDSNDLSLSSLFGLYRWNKYFHILAHSSYLGNTFQFRKCIKRQVGKVTFLKQPDRYRLVIVDSKPQAEAMLTLKDLNGKPCLISPHIN